MKFLVVDDHALVREGLRAVLGQLPEHELFEAGSLPTCLDLVTSEQPDLVILDYFLPDPVGTAAIRELVARSPRSHVIIVTASDEIIARSQKLLAAGARGLIPKSATLELLSAAIAVVQAGGVYLPPGRATEEAMPLTPRQREVLVMLSEGLPNRTIADKLEVSESTVRAHITMIFRVLNVENRTAAAREAVRRGLLPGRFLEPG